jgi:hypothetical protein
MHCYRSPGLRELANFLCSNAKKEVECIGRKALSSYMHTQMTLTRQLCDRPSPSLVTQEGTVEICLGLLNAKDKKILRKAVNQFIPFAFRVHPFQHCLRKVVSRRGKYVQFRKGRSL